MKDYAGINYFFYHCFTVVITVALLFVPSEASARYASIVIDHDSGKVLHAVNPDVRNYPASLTKMMSLYLAFEAVRDGKLRMNQRLRVSRRAQNALPSKIGLKKGTTITLREAVLAIVTKSANDAAVVIGEAIAGNEEKFSQKMTLRGRELGMTRTVFRNASGLPNKRQLSTARDMAILAHRLIKDFPKRYALFSTALFEFQGERYYNHNRLLANYPGADGLKTGYTRDSGYNLAVSVKRGSHRITGIVFGGKTADARNKHMRRLLDRAFAKIDAAGRSDNKIANNTTPRPKARPTQLAFFGLSPSGKVNSRLATLSKPWGIQIGAFAGKKPAHRAARNPASDIGNNPRRVEIDITSVRSEAMSRRDRVSTHFEF